MFYPEAKLPPRNDEARHTTNKDGAIATFKSQNGMASCFVYIYALPHNRGSVFLCSTYYMLCLRDTAPYYYGIATLATALLINFSAGTHHVTATH